MPLSEAQRRQANADREYIQACKDAGIEAAPAQYFASGETSDSSVLDSHALREGALPGFPDAIGNAEEDAYVRPEFVIPKMTMTAFVGVLEILTPGRGGLSPTAVKAAGRKVICLNWMVGRGDFAGESLNFIADQIGCSRAALSHTCRQIEDRLGLRGRGQKSVAAQQAYSDSRKKVVERQKAERHDARIGEAAILGGEQGFAIAED